MVQRALIAEQIMRGTSRRRQAEYTVQALAVFGHGLLQPRELARRTVPTDAGHQDLPALYSRRPVASWGETGCIERQVG
jgi:hypothetical protein